MGLFVKAVLEHYLLPAQQSVAVELPRPELVRSRRVCETPITPSENNLVKPQLLMAEIQRLIVEGSNAVVITEAGNSFAWGTHTLQFNTPGRYRVSTGFGAMGHAVTGVLGAALANNAKAVAIVGDGAMLMNNEISTAVQYQIPAVWIVLNDARYNMCEQGMAIQKIQGVDTEIPQTDFVAIARSMGADGIRVSHESQIEAALEKSLAATVPFVVDVLIDPTQVAPIGSRIQSLISQGAKES